MIEMLKSKIHRIPITEANLDYIGSLTLDEDWMDSSGIREYEKITVVNIQNGERLETYAIRGARGSRVCCLNGPAARKGMVGDIVIVLSYAQMTPEEADGFVPAIFIPQQDR